MKDDIICKAILIGDTGVGKTCIIKRLVSNEYDTNTISTIGATYANKNINFEEYKKVINFQIWDTAGQEQFRSLNRLFFKDAKIAILVYDITVKQTFESVKNYWYNQLIENSPKDISKIIYYLNNHLLF